MTLGNCRSEAADIRDEDHDAGEKAESHRQRHSEEPQPERRYDAEHGHREKPAQHPVPDRARRLVQDLGSARTAGRRHQPHQPARIQPGFGCEIYGEEHDHDDAADDLHDVGRDTKKTLQKGGWRRLDVGGIDVLVQDFANGRLADHVSDFFGSRRQLLRQLGDLAGNRLREKPSNTGKEGDYQQHDCQQRPADRQPRQPAQRLGGAPQADREQHAAEYHEIDPQRQP